MRAVYASTTDPDDPLSALEVGERPEPGAAGGAEVPDGWVPVRVAAASLNHHDLWTLRGVGLRTEPPVVLGCDAAGWGPDGEPVVVSAVVGDPAWTGDETLDPRRTLLSEERDGTFADVVVVPRRNLLPKPEGLSFAEAACLPTAWLTAYRMLTHDSGLRPGDVVLVQGAGGGVATAAVALGTAMGLRVWVTSRDEAKGEAAVAAGAERWSPSGERLPQRVDAVLETVGRATWKHSIRSLRPGGTVVVSGATTGDDPSADLTQVFFRQLRVVGSTMGSADELRRLLSLCVATGIRPTVDATYPLEQARTAFERMHAGDVVGKLVLEVADSP